MVPMYGQWMVWRQVIAAQTRLPRDQRLLYPYSLGTARWARIPHSSKGRQRMVCLAAETDRQVCFQMAMCPPSRCPFFVALWLENPGRQMRQSVMRPAPVVLQTASGLQMGSGCQSVAWLQMVGRDSLLLVVALPG